MKTTVKIPDALFRRPKVMAAERGQSLKTLFNEALQDKFDPTGLGKPAAGPPWMNSFGKLRGLKKETSRIQSGIDGVFGVIEPEDRL